MDWHQWNLSQAKLHNEPHSKSVGQWACMCIILHTINKSKKGASKMERRINFMICRWMMDNLSPVNNGVKYFLKKYFYIRSYKFWRDWFMMSAHFDRTNSIVYCSNNKISLFIYLVREATQNNMHYIYETSKNKLGLSCAKLSSS